MRTDPVTLQVIANHCRAAAEAMAYTLYRTAHSTFVKETEDFTIQIVDREGHTAAIPLDLGATWYPGLDYSRAMAMVQPLAPGDICCTNDPFSGFLATHSPDLHLWKPVFCEGEIVAYTAGHIHNTDIGGAVPASLSRALTDIHQEGIRIPPAKLYRAGVLDEDLMRVMLANVRVPEQNWGDLKALVGAVNTGERKVREMVARFGLRTFVDGVADLLDYAETQARSVLRSLPDGEYRFCDYCDEDVAGGDPLRLALTLRIRGDEAELDLTGTDPQVMASLNVPTGGHPRHTLILVGVYYVLYSLLPGITLNAGLTRPFTCILPEGTVVNPRFPAAVGMRSLTCARLRSLVFGAFAQAAPERLPAAPAGSSVIVNVMTNDERSGERIIAALNPVVGGAGGFPHRDGPDGSGADAAYLKNTPVEINEAEVPVKFLRYGLAPDTGGAGTHRGGCATEMAFTVFSPGSSVTARNRDRTRFRAWGTLGGRAGTPGSFWLNPGTERARDLGNLDFIRLDPGDVVRIVSPGGGGRGDPLARPAEAVARDVARGTVSAEAARAAYGVVLRDGVPDLAATEAERAARRGGRGGDAADGLYDFGPERRAFERDWTEAAYAAMGARLARVPVHWRAFVKRALFAAMAERPEAEAPEVCVARTFAALAAAHPPLRAAAAALAEAVAARPQAAD